MKKINVILLSIFAVLVMQSCQEDPIVTINPKAETGDMSFQLNQTRYSSYTYVLSEANNDLSLEALTCKQPDYGFTAAVKYFVQASFNENMSDSVELETPVNGENVLLNTKEMNKAIMQLYKGELPNPTVAKDIFVRLKAIVSEATPTPLVTEPTVKPLFSNVVKLNVLPYFMEDLVSYDRAKKIKHWYIIGLGDGLWTNSSSGFGASVVPMSVVDGNVYDSDGNGIFRYTGYIENAQGFKIITELGNWNIQWGNEGGKGINKPLFRPYEAAPQGDDFKVPEDGYYTITLNSIKNELTIEKSSVEPTVYQSMGLTGAMPDADWGSGISMDAFQTTNNHVWYKEYTYTGNFDTKFRSDGTWWGNSYFPVGLASTANAPNIPTTEGTYMVMFNDIDGFYYFFKK